jgi:hypothetical protein
MEKLNASANAIPCHNDCSFTKAMIIITKQNKLTIIVSAFFSEKYFFMILGLGRWTLHEALYFNKYRPGKDLGLLSIGKKVKNFVQQRKTF